MKRIPLEIQALSGLAIGRQKPGGSVSESDDFIPGTVIRGAIAAQILQQARPQSGDLSNPDVGGDFQTLFLSETPAIFQNAYPATLEIEGKIVPQERIEAINVLPATALSSKTKSGFCRHENGRCTGKGNGVFDTLIDRFCADGYNYPYDPNCPVDYGRVDAFTGFYTVFSDKYYSLSADKRLLTRVGINRRRATAEEQILYSIEVLNESQEKKQKPISYRGVILLPNELPNELADALHHFIDQNRNTFRLGGSTSRGLGRVEVKAKSPEDIQPEVETQIEQFNKALGKRWQTWEIFGDPLEAIADRTFFTLDLQSDAILTENWQRMMSPINWTGK